MVHSILRLKTLAPNEALTVCEFHGLWMWLGIVFVSKLYEIFKNHVAMIQLSLVLEIMYYCMDVLWKIEVEDVV